MKTLSSLSQNNQMKNVVYWTVIITTVLFLVKVSQSFPVETAIHTVTP